MYVRYMYGLYIYAIARTGIGLCVTCVSAQSPRHQLLAPAVSTTTWSPHVRAAPQSTGRALRTGMGRGAVLALWFQLAVAVAQGDTVAACSSTADHSDDVSYEACFGWCTASQAADHCSWCKVSARGHVPDPSRFARD